MARAPALALAASLLAGCPPAALDLGPNGRVDDPAPLLASLEARRVKVPFASGDARVDLQGPQGAGGLDLWVVAASPDRLRVEALSFFGQPVAVLAADGGAVRLHDLQHGRFLVATGDAQDAVVARLVPVALRVSSLVALLLGVPEAIEADRPREVALDAEARAWCVTSRHGAWVQRLWFDTVTWRPVRATLDDGAGHGHRAAFEEFGGPADLPSRVAVESSDGRSWAKFRWKNKDLQAPPESDAFVLEPPEGTEPEHL